MTENITTKSRFNHVSQCVVYWRRVSYNVVSYALDFVMEKVAEFLTQSSG